MKRIVGIALACCALVAALAGCAPAKATDAESVKGFWVLDSSVPAGFEAALNLGDENLAELVLQDAFLEGTWSADGSSASITFESADKPVSVYVSNGKLIYGSDDGTRLVFTKSSIEEYYGEGGSEGTADLTEVSSSEASSLDGMDIVDEVIQDIKAVSIADDDVCKIEVTGKGTDFTGDPCYRLTITNNGKKAISVLPADLFKVNGTDIEAGIGDVVEAGETVESTIYFSKDELGGTTDKLVKVEGNLVVSDDESGKELKTYTFKMD